MAKPKSVATQMRAHIGEYGWCRANQHIWQPPRESGQGVLTLTKGVIHIQYTCSNCGSTRTDEYSYSSGELLTRQYKRPDGYTLVVKGTDEPRPKKADWRREHFKAVLKDLNRRAT